MFNAGEVKGGNPSLQKGRGTQKGG
jgi:hypothetical protein